MKKKLFIFIVAALFAVAVMAGCSGRGSSSADYNAQESYTAASSAYSNYEYDAPAAAAEDYYYEEGYYEASTTAEAKSEDAGGTAANPALANAKLIYTAYFDMETTEFDEAVNSLKSRVERAGGYVENSNLSNSGSYRYASYIVRIPSENYRSFCDAAGDIGSIRSFNESVENISELYSDTEARLSSAKVKLETLQELLKKAETMEDIITIQNAINDVQYDIDYYSGNLRRYDSLVSFSTVHMDIREVSRLSGTVEPPIGFGQELSQAFQRGTQNFVEGLQDLAIGFARHFIGWLIFIAICVAAFFITKGAIKKSKIKQQQHQQALYQQQMAYRAMQAQAAAPVSPVPQQEEKSNAPASDQGPAGH